MYCNWLSNRQHENSIKNTTVICSDCGNEYHIDDIDYDDPLDLDCGWLCEDCIGDDEDEN